MVDINWNCDCKIILLVWEIKELNKEKKERSESESKEEEEERRVRSKMKYSVEEGE